MLIRFLPYGFLITVLCAVIFVSLMPKLEINATKNPSTHQYLIVTHPWNSFEQTLDTVLQADGRPVSVGAFPFILRAYSSDPDFMSTAYHNGAMLVLDPFVSGACFRNSKNQFIKA